MLLQFVFYDSFEYITPVFTHFQEGTREGGERGSYFQKRGYEHVMSRFYAMNVDDDCTNMLNT